MATLFLAQSMNLHKTQCHGQFRLPKDHTKPTQQWPRAKGKAKKAAGTCSCKRSIDQPYFVRVDPNRIFPRDSEQISTVPVSVDSISSKRGCRNRFNKIREK